MIRKRPTKRWASASLVLGSAVAVLASPFALGTAAAVGIPTNIVLTPDTPAGGSPTTVPTGNCEAYSVLAQDNNGAAANEAFTFTVTETSSANPGATPFKVYSNAATPSSPCSGTGTAVGTTTGTGPYTTTYSLAGVFNASGQAYIGVSSSSVGTGSVKVAATGNGAVSDQDNVSWTASTADAVTKLVASPTSTTQATGTTAKFTVTAEDTNNNPISGVPVFEETTGSTNPDQVADTTSCGSTNASGQATCSVTNGGNAGTDSLVFWVNNSNGTTHSQGPDNGEPQTTASAVFNAGPPFVAANSTLTCTQHTAPNQNTQAASCTVPTSATSETFTATVEDANHNPLSGVTVNFAATAAKLGGTTVTGTSLPSGTGVTNASGQATFSVSDPTPAAGDNVTMTANIIGKSFGGNATATWAAPVASAVSVQPVLQSVVRGGTVTVKAQVTDQFGNALATQPTLTYVVNGRNLKAGTAAADGTITYTDSGTTGNTDTIKVTDSANASITGSATVSYVASTTASTVTVDTSGKGVSDATCGATGNTAATNVASGATTEVCAIVKNSSGEALAGAPVTFTVSGGQVAGTSTVPTSAGTSYSTTTDQAGVAEAYVTSTKSGAQTVTATSGTATGNAAVTYASPSPAQAYTVTVSPTTATIAAGGSQKFTATVTDKTGNPVANVNVVYTQTGAGSVGNGNNQVITASDGTASVTVTTASTDSGAGTLSFSIAAGGNQCSTTGGTCSATASYTVAAAGASGLVLRAPVNGTVGGNVTLTGHATNATGASMAGQLIRFYVGVNGKAVAIGSATTGPAGNASVHYSPTKAGKTSFAAFADTNNDQIRESNEPTSSASTQVRFVERPRVVLTSTHNRVTVHVHTRPAARNALVRYFVKTHGVWHRIGTSRTGPGGNASMRFVESSGHRLSFRVNVTRTPRTTVGTSAVRTIRVR